MEIKKEDILEVISWYVVTGNYEILLNLCSKMFKASEVHKFLLKRKSKYCIVGNGVIASDKFTEMLQENNWEKFEENFIPLKDEKTLEAFKERVQQEVDNEEKSLEKIEEITNEKIWQTIKKHISIIEDQEEVFQIVKNSDRLKGEELKKQMDKVYKITSSQQNTTEIFMVNPNIKISKNFYVVKERKESGVI